jgi:phage shock protein PspC (stress-responsive transcriptional regulator)
MVGFATAPIEREYFGMRFTVVRNIVSFLAALDIAGGMVVLYAIL